MPKLNEQGQFTGAPLEHIKQLIKAELAANQPAPPAKLPHQKFILEWVARGTTTVAGSGNQGAHRHFLDYDPNTKVGIIHLDFTVPAGKVAKDTLFQLPEKTPDQTPVPVPASLIELQSITPSPTGNGGIWMDKGSRKVQTDAITAPGRYILNILGFFEVPNV